MLRYRDLQRRSSVVAVTDKERAARLRGDAAGWAPARRPRRMFASWQSRRVMAIRESEPNPVGMPRAELLTYLRSHPTVSLWPFAGKALGASRSLTYQLSRDGTIRVLRLGHRCRVASAWLEATLFGGE